MTCNCYNLHIESDDLVQQMPLTFQCKCYLLVMSYSMQKIYIQFYKIINNSNGCTNAFSMRHLSPFWKSGIIFDFLISVGKTHVFKIKLNNKIQGRTVHWNSQWYEMLVYSLNPWCSSASTFLRRLVLFLGSVLTELSMLL